jgi:hypothetical protein
VFDWDDIEEEELEKQQQKFHQGLLAADEAHQEGENKSSDKIPENQQSDGSIHDFIGSVEVPSKRTHSRKRTHSSYLDG